LLIERLIGTSAGFKNKMFFQVDIVVKQNVGTGDLFDTADRLMDLFKERTINDVVVEKVELLGGFSSGVKEVLPVRFTVFSWTD
jgi:hypothetical protein